MSSAARDSVRQCCVEGVPMHFATSYLEFAPALPWQRFLRQLDEFSLGCNEDAALDAVRGARRVFELFASLLTQVHA